jgi:hypothetical protein
MERANGEYMGWDALKARFNDHRIVPGRGKKRRPMRCDAMLSRVPHIQTLDESMDKGLMETFGIS